jgi:hypothetical protein
VGFHRRLCVRPDAELKLPDARSRREEERGRDLNGKQFYNLTEFGPRGGRGPSLGCQVVGTLR